MSKDTKPQWALRAAEQVVRRGCRHLPESTREEREREWIAELPIIVSDPDLRFAWVRRVKLLLFAAGVTWVALRAAKTTRARREKTRSLGAKLLWAAETFTPFTLAFVPVIGLSIAEMIFPKLLSPNNYPLLYAVGRVLTPLSVGAAGRYCHRLHTRRNVARW
ncbi:MAG TPA: hypothetical protein VFA06_12395 [Actinocrinis sp.]|uniref:hypothetical protein n=1 Tax=Actinocrinis sp. TaxID=1920516 RepID=UPI002D5138ED|nr:hypothetical protein [Actinocrinis sp.]HZU56663.1 hypothetical protein [Actinocrinis sp.]